MMQHLNFVIVLSCWYISFEYCIFISNYCSNIVINHSLLQGDVTWHLTKFAANQLMITLFCQVADHVSVNCWLSRRSICFSLLLFRTSLSSHPTAVMRWCVVRRSALQLIQSILMSDSYRDPLTDCSPASSPAFHQFRN